MIMKCVKIQRRIGIDAHLLGDHSGGNETFYFGFLSCMTIPNGIKCFLFVTKKANVEKFKEKFEIVYFKSTNAFFRNFVELPKFCVQYKLDLLHTQYFIPFIRFCPVICTIHDICFEHFENIFTKKEMFIQKVLIPYAAKHSKSIITVSQFSKDDISRKFGVDKEKIFVVYNAPKDVFKNLPKNNLNMEKLRSKYHIKNKYVLSVGNLQPRKNLKRLINAFVGIKKENNLFDVQLVIVGKKAWLFDDILKESIKNQNDVLMTGYVSEQELVQLYNGAECFVYPSIFEGFGLPPIEAMACGVPVVVSNQSAIPEVVGDAGVFFNPFDEKDIGRNLLKMIKNESLRNQKVQLGLEQLKKFKWEKSAKKILEIYENAFEKESFVE